MYYLELIWYNYTLNLKFFQSTHSRYNTMCSWFLYEAKNPVVFYLKASLIQKFFPSAIGAPSLTVYSKICIMKSEKTLLSAL